MAALCKSISLSLSLALFLDCFRLRSARIEEWPRGSHTRARRDKNHDHDRNESGGITIFTIRTPRRCSVRLLVLVALLLLLLSPLPLLLLFLSRDLVSPLIPLLGPRLLELKYMHIFTRSCKMPAAAGNRRNNEHKTRQRELWRALWGAGTALLVVVFNVALAVVGARFHCGRAEEAPTGAPAGVLPDRTTIGLCTLYGTKVAII